MKKNNNVRKEILQNWTNEKVKSLSPYERDKLLPSLISDLRGRIGKNMRITSTDLIQLYKSRGQVISSRQIRLLISIIRCGNMVPMLISTSTGYWVAETPRELNRYLNTNLRSRTKNMLMVLAAMEMQYASAVGQDDIVEDAKRLFD